MKNKFVLGKLLAFGIMFPTILIAQDLPKIIHPSPETSALFRFQDYPMDHSTGLPQISIPLYEVQSGSLSVPISISYHASGRRVTDQDGPISVGWSLSAGGIISRTLYGSVDFGTGSITGSYPFPYPFQTGYFTNFDNYEYFEKIIHYDKGPCINSTNFLDSEFDIFSYSFGNNSGKFFFNDVNGVKTAKTLPYKPYKITPIVSSSGLDAIEVIDDVGDFYKFARSEKFGWSNSYVTTGYALQQIISADKSDTITFSYTGSFETNVSISQQEKLMDTWQMDNEPFPLVNPESLEFTNSEPYDISRLTQIDFKQGKVVFNLVSGTSKIDNIQVLNRNNEVIKTIQLNRSLLNTRSDGASATNKLNAIIFKDNVGSEIEKYSFEYYPLAYQLSTMDLRHCDYWGYFNASGVHDMVPRYDNVQYIGSGGTTSTITVGTSYNHREPDLEGLKSGVLKKITYPTGGNTEFIYENNKYIDYSIYQSGLVRNGPGLRLAQIKSADNNGTVVTKTYKYGSNECGYGSIDLKPSLNAMASEFNYIYYYRPEVEPVRAGSYRERTFYSGFKPEVSDLASRPIVYTEIAEYLGTPAQNNGKTIYEYDYYPWGAMGMQQPGGMSIPKMHISNWNYWNNPSLIKKTDYQSFKNGGILSYQKKKETINNYTITNLEEITGLHVQRIYEVPQTGVVIAPCVSVEAYAAHFANTVDNLDVFPIYAFNDYKIPVGYKDLTSTSEIVYTDNNTTITNGVSYQYNSNRLNSKTTTTSSKGSSIVTDIKYPFDYTGNSLLTQMVSLNMLNYPVEQIETKSSTPTKSVRTNYFNWGTNPARIAPQTVEVKVGSGNYETRLRYSAYDMDGNPLTVSKENDHLISYVWGYNNTYPIAEVMNTAVKNVFHTSFEDADGNSGLNDSKTGRRSRTGGYSKSLSNLDNGSYIFSYWQKSGSNWVLQTSSVSVTTGAYPITLTGQVDEVRFYPKTSQMKTFTYEPLVGVITQCDPSDHTSYYEYDSYNRLKLIRDMNGNILKTFKYQYQGTTSN